MASPTGLRLAFVCPFGLSPKATVSARALPMAAALAARGHRPALFVPPWDDPGSSGTCFEQEGVRVVQVSTAGGHPAMLMRLLREVLAYSPDVVHFFRPKGHPAMVAQALRLRAALGKRMPLVLDADDWEGPGGWNDALPYRRWQKRLFAAQECWAYRQADAVTVASETLRGLAWSLGASPGRVFHVPNALAAPLPEPRAAEVVAARERYGLGDRAVLLYTRFVEFPPVWPLAFVRELRRVQPGASLLVLGEGLRGEYEELRAAAREAGAADGLALAGWPGKQALPALARACAVAIVPFQDSLIARAKSSVKPLELMSLGVPVVASALGENPAYLGYGEAGLLLDGSLEPGIWAKVVAGLLGDDERRAALGQVAAARLRRLYVWERVVEKVEAAYASVV